MKKVIPIVAVVLILFGWVVWRGQDKQVLKRQCKTLIAMADQVSGGIGIFDVNRLDGLLSDEVTFNIDILADEPFRAGKAEVLAAYQWLGGNVQKSKFRITEFHAVPIDDGKAEVQTRVEGMLEMPEMRMIDGAHAVDFTWEKTEDGAWKLTGFSFLQVI